MMTIWDLGDLFFGGPRQYKNGRGFPRPSFGDVAKAYARELRQDQPDQAPAGDDQREDPK